MNKNKLLGIAAALGVLWIMALPQMRDAHAQGFVPPLVFQAAGPTAESIQGVVDAFRDALGEPNNGNAPGPLLVGRREINWDGGGNNDTTTDPVTPFDVFLNSRGARFSTPGKGLTQAPPSGGPQGGLAGLFDNDSYGTIFSTFSPLRLFSPVGSNVTEGLFFIPGTTGSDPVADPGDRATVTGFGAVFTDVDQQRAERRSSTLIEYFGANDRLLLSSFVPASPGDGGLSFFGVVFEEARIARVRIRTGDAAPGPDDTAKTDIVVMDDFIYGEPQPIDSGTSVVSVTE
jgi:hypothetical protein